MPYSLTRATVIRGPAVLKYTNTTGTVYFFAKDDIQVTYGNSTFDINNSSFGVVDKRIQQRTVEVSFTPTGELTADMMAVLFPYAAGLPGDSAFALSSPAGSEPDPATTIPSLTVIPRSGQQYAFYGAIVTKMPQLALSATKTQVGSVQFTCIGKEGVLWSTANSMFTAASNTYAAAVAASAWTTSAVKTVSYLGTYGSTIGNAGTFSTKDGFMLDFSVQLDPVESDTYGIFDWTLGSVVATCSCAPMDVTADQIAALIPMQGATSADRGSSLISGANLVLAPADSAVTDRTVTIYNATVLQTGWAFGLSTQRIPQLQFTSIRSLDGSNVLQPAFAIA